MVRCVLFSTCTLFLITWLPYFTCSLVTASPFLHGELQICWSARSTMEICADSVPPLSSECSLVLLTFGLLSNPLIHPGQNKDVQVSRTGLKSYDANSQCRV